MRSKWIVGTVVAVALLAAACSGDEDASDSESTTTSAVPTSEASDESSTTSSTEAPSEEDLPEGIERTDYLTFANGTTVVSVEGPPDGNSGVAVAAIDGEPGNRTVTNTGTTTEVSFVYELPAPTSFDRLAVPAVTETPGNATFFRDIEISGSAESATAGFVTLAEGTLEEHDADTEFTELVPVDDTAVRWVRVHLANGLLIEPGDEDVTNLEFTEVIGNGSQEPLTASDAFTGVWSYKPADAAHLDGELLELHQEGATVTGCLGTVAITGNVNGNILKATGIDSRDDRESAYILLPDPAGGLQGVASTRGSIFGAHIAPVAPEGSTTPCSQAPPVVSACGSIVYVNFDVDSAAVRAESEPVLDDLFGRLEAEGVTAISVEGHTSSEGEEAYNQDLSERRAASVVEALVSRGLDGSTMTAVGKGESELLVSPERDESARSLNRRVEIVCA